MALFNSTSAYDTTEYSDDLFDIIQEGNYMMMEMMEESYRLDGAIYLTDAMLENQRAEGVSEADLSVLMEEAKVGFKEKVKNFFKMLWQKIREFFKRLKDGIKRLFTKKKAKAKAAKDGNGAAVDNSEVAGEVKEMLNEAQKDINSVTNSKDDESVPSPSEATANIDAYYKRREERLAKRQKKVATTEAERKANAEKNLKAIEEIEKMVDKFIDDNIKLVEQQAKLAERKIDAAGDPEQLAKIKAVHLKAANAIDAIAKAAAAKTAHLVDKANKFDAQTKEYVNDTHKAYTEYNKDRMKAFNDVAKSNAPNMTAIKASWDPSLETWVFEGDDTPDLEDLDDDLKTDDVDEGCGKSVKESAAETLLDKAYNMIAG